jgi:hypothetical protein
MTEKRTWLEWQAWLAAPVRPTIINEPLEPEPETAEQRSRRIWRMDERKLKG